MIDDFGTSSFLLDSTGGMHFGIESLDSNLEVPNWNSKIKLDNQLGNFVRFREFSMNKHKFR